MRVAYLIFIQKNDAEIRGEPNMMWCGTNIKYALFKYD